MYTPATKSPAVTNNYRRGWSALMNATHEFASRERPTREEISKYKELFYTLCLKSPDPEIRIISNTLAFNTYVPRSIVYLLSLCNPQIAEQMVLFSPVLKSRDLKAIIHKAGRKHAALVARRNDIDASVVQSILSLDNKDGELRSILKENISFTHNSEIQSLLKADAMATFAESDVSETPTQLAEPATSTQTTARDASDALMQLAGKGGKLGRGNVTQPAAEASAPIKDGIKLLEYAREHQHSAFAWRIERRCKLATEYTTDLLGKRDAGGIATILRSLEVSKAEAARILLLTAPDIGRNAQVFNKVVEMYGKLNVEECRAYLKTHGAEFDTGWQMTTDRMRSIRAAALRPDRRDRPMPNIKIGDEGQLAELQKAI